MKKDMHLRIHVKKLIFVFSTTVAVGYVLFPKDSSPGVSNGNHEKVALFHQKPSFIKNQTCQFKKKSIFYIKIQKTGSSTVKSMLYNYASKHDMKICLDHTDVHHMNFPYRLDESKLVKLSGKHQCEMVADELVLDKPQGFNHVFTSFLFPESFILNLKNNVISLDLSFKIFILLQNTYLLLFSFSFSIESHVR